MRLWRGATWAEASEDDVDDALSEYRLQMAAGRQRPVDDRPDEQVHGELVVEVCGQFAPVDGALKDVAERLSLGRDEAGTGLLQLRAPERLGQYIGEDPGGPRLVERFDVPLQVRHRVVPAARSSHAPPRRATPMPRAAEAPSVSCAATAAAAANTLRVPKTCATWAKALQSAVERSVCAGPVLARLEVG